MAIQVSCRISCYICQAITECCQILLLVVSFFLFIYLFSLSLSLSLSLSPPLSLNSSLLLHFFITFFMQLLIAAKSHIYCFFLPFHFSLSLSPPIFFSFFMVRPTSYICGFSDNHSACIISHCNPGGGSVITSHRLVSLQHLTVVLK